jgi:flagella basal body P-ring formation protein FlgA
MADGRTRHRARILPSLVAAISVLLAINTAASGDVPVKVSPWHSTDDIARAAEDFLREKLGRSDPRLSLQAGWVDPRVQMPRCSEALSGFLRRGTKISSRTVVGVRCEGGNPWKMYIAVDVWRERMVAVMRST